MAGNNNYFVRPMKQLVEALAAKGVEVPAPGDEADLAAKYPSEEPVSYMSIFVEVLL